MGTDQAESHTARKFRKISVCPAPVDVQVMLFSISSISILSSVVAMSVTSKRRPPRPCSRRPSPPLHLRTAATKQLHAQGQKTVSFSTRQAGSNGLLRARVAEGGQRRARAVAAEAARERSRSTFEVLKSTGCPKTVHDPAFRARCACPPPRGGRPGPEEGLLPAVIRREKAAIRRRPSRRIYRKLQFVMNTRYDFHSLMW